MKREQNGFTLVELAIALMVIGLLIGGVLKGQELIENARITATIRDLKGFDTAVMIFRSSYGALPGDMRNPGTRLPNCTAALCNVTTGNGDGVIAEATNEEYNFFPHLTVAGMIKGPAGGTTAPTGVADFDAFYPTTPHDNYWRVHGYTINNVNTYISDGVTAPQFTPAQAAQIDRKLDDGLPMSGDVHALIVAAAQCFTASSPQVYNEASVREKACKLFVTAGF